MKSVQGNFRLLTFFCSLLIFAQVTAKEQDGQTEHQKTALSMFAERCKGAGKFIRRTSTNVQGVLLLKVRPKVVNYGDQFALTDPYGNDLSGEAYIASFLRGSAEYWAGKEVPQKGAKGFSFVDALDEKNVRYRYTGSVKDVKRTESVMNGGDGQTRFMTRDFITQRVLTDAPSPQFGITFDDVSTPEERQYWIAASSLKVIDLHTNEVIAERIGYMVDVGQGSRAGGRSPWLIAADRACPSFPGRQSSLTQLGQAARFVQEVLTPAQ
jgi:hypothetical protein